MAAYIREVVPNNGLRSPLDLQRQLYENVISGHPSWILAGIYIDKGSAVALEGRPGLTNLLGDCEKGMIDVIICKNISRISRNMMITLDLIHKLEQYDPPIGIYFEAEQIFTLGAEGFEDAIDERGNLSR